MNQNTIDFLKTGTVAELRYGVEIEFSDAGNLAQECGPRYCSDDAEQSLNDNAEDWLQSHLGCTYQVAREMLRHGTLEDFIDGFTSWSWSSFVESECDSMNENSDYSEDTEFSDVSGWSHCEDGTSGIVREYQSDVGNLEETVENVETLFDEAGRHCVVPLNGSCHIHVSIPGSKHSATNESELHCCLLFELSQRIGRFPQTVRDRMKTERARTYFEFNARCTSKFTTIHLHNLGTWEFRIFGHMTDPREIETCLNIAGETFLAAYRRFNRRDYAIASADEFRTMFAECMETGVPMGFNSIQREEPVVAELAGV